MLSRISNFWGGKFGVESAISNLEFGGGVENLGWKILSRISNFWGGKFGVESAISNLKFGGEGWKIWGGKCYLEISNLGGGGGGKFGVENAISNLLFGWVENLG